MRPASSLVPRDISDHALIGDMRSAALVGDDGTVDWFCPGRFDGPRPFGAMARTWRAGCIIRARFLDDVAVAYGRDPELPLLLADPFFTEVLAGAIGPWRRGVAQAATAGVPAPAFSSSLAYYDGVRAERLPAALVQGQRDFFGAHTYRRTDRPGTFHTNWSGGRDEETAPEQQRVGRAETRPPEGGPAPAPTAGGGS